MLDDDSHTFLTQTAYSVSEGSFVETSVQITVRCSYLSYQQSLTADYIIIPDTAHAGEDYLPIGYSVTLTGNMGGTATQSFVIPILRDIEVEPDERFYVALTSVSEGYLGRGLPGDPYTQATVTITDNPPCVGVTLISNGSEVKAPATPHPIVVGVSCGGGDMSKPVTASLHLRPMPQSIAQADAQDLSFSQVTFVVQENYVRETYKVIEIPVIDDNQPEWLETAWIEAVPGTNCLSGASAYATIIDNDSGMVYQNLPEETEPTPNEIDPGGYVARNLDDDNANGIADYLDGQQSSGADPDDDLQPVTVDLPETYAGDVAQATFSTGQNNKLRLWLDQARTQPVSTSPYDWDDVPATIYVEGIGPGESGITMIAQYGTYDYPGHILWEYPPIGDAVTITTMALTVSLGTPVFAHNPQNPQALECMEETDLRWAITVDGIPSGAMAEVRLRLEEGIGVITMIDNGTVGLVASFAQVPDGDADHHYTGVARAEATVYGITVHSAPVNTEVWELSVTQFDGGKPWKVCVGDDISYAAAGSPDLMDWFWTMPEGKWHLMVDGSDPEAFGASGTAYIPYYDEENATNADFGDRYGTVAVQAIDANGKLYFAGSTDDAGRKSKVFFDPNKAVDGSTPTTLNPPAWFVFWQQTGAGNPMVDYDNSVTEDGVTSFTEDNQGRVATVSLPRVGPSASGSSVLGGNNTTNHGILRGAAISGIDKFHITVLHEMLHYSDMTASIGKPDPDDDEVWAGLEGDTNGNGIFDPGETDPTLHNTHNISQDDDSEYRAYWREVNVWASDIGNYDNVDWSKGGKQW